MRIEHLVRGLARAASVVALCVVLTAGAAGCASLSTGPDPDFPEPANMYVRKDIERRVAEIKFMHDTELLQNLERLVGYTDMAVPAVRRGLEDEDWLTRVGCLWVLSRLGDKRNIPHVRRTLDDSKPEVRYEAAATLVELGDATGFPVIVEGLANDDVRIRFKCRTELTRHVGTDFGFQHDGPVAERQEGLQRWRNWLSDHDMQPK